MERTRLADRKLPDYTRGEDIANMVTHIVGGVIGITALILALIKSVCAKDIYGVVCGIVYGLSMTALYAVSSVYHGLHPGMGKKVMQVIDHCTIYFMITGRCMEPVCRGMGSCGICLRIYGNRSPKIQGIIHDMLYFNGLVHNVCAQADRADNRQDSVYVAAVGRNSLYSRGGAVRNRKQKKIFSHGIPYFRGHRQPAAGGMRVGLCIINEQ